MRESKSGARPLALLRRAVGLSQAEVAGRLGRSRSYVGRLEAEEPAPSAAVLERYLSALDSTWFDLLVALAAVAAGETELPTRLRSALPGVGLQRGSREMAWLARELLATQRELERSRRGRTKLRREFDRLREALALNRSRSAARETARAGRTGPRRARAAGR